MSNQVYIQNFNESGNLKGFPENFEIGTKEDGGVIGMFSIKNKLYALKDLALYELQINKPENEAIDQETKVIQKVVIRRGPDSDFVAKTLLTAKSVFQHGNFKEKIREEIFGLCVDTLFEFSHLLEAVESYNTLEEKEIESFKSSPKSKSNFVLPSIADIRTHAKTIFQKTDQISQNLISIIKLFYPSDKKKDGNPFEQLYEHFKLKYGEDCPYTIYLNKNHEFFCHIRFIRNGLDHTKAPFVNIEDFNYEADELVNPKISLNRTECKLKPTNFKEYINEILKAYPYLFEYIITMVADDNIENNVFGFRIRELPEERRRFKNVRFAFWSPVGTDGYYNMNM